METNTMIKTNTMSAAQLKEQRQSNIKIINGNNGKTFFTCGEKDGQPMYGYVSKRAIEALRSGEAGLNDLEYAEIHVEGREEPIPTLMMISKNVEFVL